MTANDSLILASVKVDLGMNTSTVYDGKLLDNIELAKTRIAQYGIVLDDSISHNQLVAMYAEWLWRFRRTGEKMPPMLRDSLNDELFYQKGNAT